MRPIDAISLATPATASARPLRTVMMACVVAFCAAILIATLAMLPSRTHRWDFSLYYASALMMRQGGNPYVQSIAPIGRRLGLQTTPIERADFTPTFLWCFEPLTLLKPDVAYWIWFAINIAALAGALAILIAPARLTLADSLVIAGLAILFPPVAQHLFWAQSQFLVLIALAAAFALCDRGYDSAGALAIAAASLLRIFPIVIAGYFIVRWRPRVIAWLVTWIVIGGLATCAGVGFARCLSYVGTFLALGRSGSSALPAFLALSPTNISIVAFVSRPFYWFGAGALGPVTDTIRYAIIVAGEIAVIVATVRVTLPSAANVISGKAAAATDDSGAGFALWTAAILMLSPIVWPHYQVLLIIPFVLVACAWARGAIEDLVIRGAVLAYVLIAILTPSLTILDYRSSNFFSMIAAETGFIALTSAYAFACRFARSKRSRRR